MQPEAGKFTDYVRVYFSIESISVKRSAGTIQWIEKIIVTGKDERLGDGLHFPQILPENFMPGDCKKYEITLLKPGKNISDYYYF